MPRKDLGGIFVNISLSAHSAVHNFQKKTNPSLRRWKTLHSPMKRHAYTHLTEEEYPQPDELAHHQGFTNRTAYFTTVARMTAEDSLRQTSFDVLTALAIIVIASRGARRTARLPPVTVRNRSSNGRPLRTCLRLRPAENMDTGLRTHPCRSNRQTLRRPRQRRSTGDRTPPPAGRTVQRT